MTEQIDAAVTNKPAENAAETAQKQEQTFTQAEVNRIVKERLERAEAKAAEARAGEQATAEERIAALEKQNGQLAHERLVARIQAKHGISEDDAALFLTGADEDALNAQAARLAERDQNQKKQGGIAPNEGKTTTSIPVDKKREWLRSIKNE